MKINEAVRQMHPPRYTLSQVAELIGKDERTVRRWVQKDIYRPSETKSFGKTVVHLYSDDDVKAMKKIAREIKPGRKWPRRAPRR